jgi:hypothetical protein
MFSFLQKHKNYSMKKTSNGPIKGLIKNAVKNHPITGIVKTHVSDRLAQVQEQLAIAQKYNDLVEIAIYSRLERELKKLNGLVNGK